MSPHLTRPFTALAVLAALAGCPQPMPSHAVAAPRAPDFVVRSYPVPPSAAREATGLVRALLKSGDEERAHGVAALTPNEDELVISATLAFHEGIAPLVKRLQAAPPAPPPTLVLDYWVIEGRPAPEATPPAEVAPEVAPALTALQKSQGPMQLSLYDRVRVTSASGEKAQARGSFLNVEQRASARDGAVFADVNLAAVRDLGELTTRLTLPPGEVVVLGQVGASLSMEGAKEPRQPANLYFLVRTEVQGTR